MRDKEIKEFSLTCPPKLNDFEKILLSHGGGGRHMHQLIDKVISPILTNRDFQSPHDSAVLNFNGTKMAFTTDSFVVSPIFFPGGDIGKIAVFGTVNDLAMSGAKPLYLSLGLILEEGFPMESLKKILTSIRQAADLCGVHVVTGDTKVVDHGKGDGIYINTSGVGLIEHQLKIHPESVQAGDAVLISGDLGRHGICIMAQREGLGFESNIESDCCSLSEIVRGLIANNIDIHCLRDLTRGGLASALNEIATVANLGIEIEESNVPVDQSVRSACELLGFDPLYVANEGRFVAFVPSLQADQALSIIRSHTDGKQASLVGHVLEKKDPIVVVKNQIGSRRILDMLSGEQLPRIC